MTDFSLLYTPKNHIKTNTIHKESSVSKSFRSLFANHYIPKSFKNSLHSTNNLSNRLEYTNKITNSQSTCLKSEETSQKTRDFLKNANNYRKILENKLILDETAKKNAVIKEFTVFKEFNKSFENNDLLIKDMNNHIVCHGEQDIYYFLYNLNEFFNEKTRFFNENPLNEKSIKEIFSYILDQIQ